MSFLNKEFHDRLYYGVKAIFGRWTAFSLAVDGEWAGYLTREKAEWFIETMADYLFDGNFMNNVENDSLDIDNTIEILCQIMMDEFNVQLEDNSEQEVRHILNEVSRHLLKLYEELRAGNLENYNILVDLRKHNPKNSINMTKEDSEDSLMEE